MMDADEQAALREGAESLAEILGVDPGELVNETLRLVDRLEGNARDDDAIDMPPRNTPLYRKLMTGLVEHPTTMNEISDVVPALMREYGERGAVDLMAAYIRHIERHAVLILRTADGAVNLDPIMRERSQESELEAADMFQQRAPSDLREDEKFTKSLDFVRGAYDVMDNWQPVINEAFAAAHKQPEAVYAILRSGRPATEHAYTLVTTLLAELWEVVTTERAQFTDFQRAAVRVADRKTDLSELLEDESAPIAELLAHAGALLADADALVMFLGDDGPAPPRRTRPPAKKKRKKK